MKLHHREEEHLQQLSTLPWPLFGFLVHGARSACGGIQGGEGHPGLESRQTPNSQPLSCRPCTASPAVAKLQSMYSFHCSQRKCAEPEARESDTC